MELPRTFVHFLHQFNVPSRNTLCVTNNVLLGRVVKGLDGHQSPLFLAEGKGIIVHNTEIVIGEAKGIVFSLCSMLSLMIFTYLCRSGLLWVWWTPIACINSCSISAGNIHLLLGLRESFWLSVEKIALRALVIINDDHPIARGCFSES